MLCFFCREHLRADLNCDRRKGEVFGKQMHKNCLFHCTFAFFAATYHLSEYRRRKDMMV